MRKLNDIFNLSTDVNAIKFPIRIYPHLWKHLDQNVGQYLCEHETFVEFSRRLTKVGNVKFVAEIIYAHSPYWMLYADKETVVKDIDELLKRAF